MNIHLNDPRHPWARLTTAARTVRNGRETAVPYGFATRVAALAMGQDRRVVSLFDLFALRALAVACVLAVVSIAMNYSELSNRMAGTVPGGVDDLLLPVNDAVSVVLALAD